LEQYGAQVFTAHGKKGDIMAKEFNFPKPKMAYKSRLTYRSICMRFDCRHRDKKCNECIRFDKYEAKNGR
jgi:hypothetical protein